MSVVVDGQGGNYIPEVTRPCYSTRLTGTAEHGFCGCYVYSVFVCRVVSCVEVGDEFL